jgi:hypothetical protein
MVRFYKSENLTWSVSEYIALSKPIGLIYTTVKFSIMDKIFINLIGNILTKNVTKLNFDNVFNSDLIYMLISKIICMDTQLIKIRIGANYESIKYLLKIPTLKKIQIYNNEYSETTDANQFIIELFRTNFTTIHFEKTIFKHFCYVFENLSSLKFTKCDLSNDAINDIIKLVNDSIVTKLGFINCKISIKAYKKIIYLIKNTNKLKKLDLSGFYSDIKLQNIRLEIIDAIKNNNSLTYVNLNHNGLNSVNVIDIIDSNASIKILRAYTEFRNDCYHISSRTRAKIYNLFLTKAMSGIEYKNITHKTHYLSI